MLGEMTTVKEGDYILLMDKKCRKWLVKVEKDKKFYTHHGEIDLGDLIGIEYGSIVETHKGKKLIILKPSVIDYIMKSGRPTQIVYPKDIGYIILRLGIKPGYSILEVGTGSGAITTALTWILNGVGKIDTYEKREDIAKAAKKNIMRIPGNEVVNLHVMDFRDAELPSNEYDVAIIDMDSPWTILKKVYDALKPGSYIALIIPTYNQLDKVLDELNTYFTDIEAIEIFYRNLQAKKGKIRPEFRMIGYTTIVVTAAKKPVT